MADQERVRALLQDTILLLCRTGLTFDTELKIEGVIGVTVNKNNVFIVHINETLTSDMSYNDLNLSLLSTSHDLAIGGDSASVSDTEINDKCEDAEPCNVNIFKEQELEKRLTNERSVICKDDSAIENDENFGSDAADVDAENAVYQPSQLNGYRRHSYPRRGVKPGYRRGRRRGPRRSKPSASQVIDVVDPKVFEILQETGHNLSANIWNKEKEEFHPAAAAVVMKESNENNSYMNGASEVDGFEDNSSSEALNMSMERYSQLGTLEDAMRQNAAALSEMLGGGRAFMCEFSGCGLSFAHSYTLYRHQRLKHGRRHGTTDQPLFYCPHENCTRVFCREVTLNNHRRDTHGDLVI